EATRAIARPLKSPLLRIISNLSLHFAAVRAFSRDSCPDFHCLDGLNGHNRARQLPVELRIPLRVAPQTRRSSVRHDLEDSADRICRAHYLIDFLLHARLGLRVHAAQWGIEIRAHGLDLLPLRLPLQAHMPHPDHV